MSLSGDLSTLELTDLLQNLELHRRTGTLVLEGEPGASLYVREGKVALLAGEERPGLVEILVAAAVVDAETLAGARKKRRRSGKSLGEILVAMQAIEADALKALARERLVADVCELIAAEAGTFTFEPGPVPRGVFDPEERKLDLALPIGPLLLESARRTDHWRRIRSRIPSDAAHYRVERKRRPKELENDTLTGVLMELCDGSRSVAEVVACVPHRRFDAYERLATLVEERCLRPMEVDDLAAAARRLAATDTDRASELVRRGQAVHGRHPELLEAEVALAEARGEPEAAVEALKLIAHQRLEAGEGEAAREALERAIGLDPDDAALRERALDLALTEGRRDDALREGRTLVDLLRAPGLHRKACGVLERLMAVAPEEWELVKEHAASVADCGDAAAAVRELDAWARARVAARDLDGARGALEELLALDAGHAGARALLDDLESGAFARRVEWRRRTLRRVALALASLALLAAGGLELTARRALVRALDEVGRRQLVEERLYREAAAVLEAVADDHPFSLTAADARGLAAGMRARE